MPHLLPYQGVPDFAAHRPYEERAAFGLARPFFAWRMPWSFGARLGGVGGRGRANDLSEEDIPELVRGG